MHVRFSQGMYVLTRPPFEEIRIAPDRTDKGEEGVGGGGGGGTLLYYTSLYFTFLYFTLFYLTLFHHSCVFIFPNISSTYPTQIMWIDLPEWKCGQSKR